MVAMNISLSTLMDDDGSMNLYLKLENSKTRKVYSVQCTVYSVQCAVYSVQCTVYSVQCTVYSVQCTGQCTVYSVQCTLDSVQCTLDSVQCTVYSAQRTAYSVQLKWMMMDLYLKLETVKRQPDSTRKIIRKYNL